MKASITKLGDYWVWTIEDKKGQQFAGSPMAYTRRSDAKRGLIRFMDAIVWMDRP